MSFWFTSVEQVIWYFLYVARRDSPLQGNSLWTSRVPTSIVFCSRSTLMQILLTICVDLYFPGFAPRHAWHACPSFLSNSRQLIKHPGKMPKWNQSWLLWKGPQKTTEPKTRKRTTGNRHWAGNSCGKMFFAECRWPRFWLERFFLAHSALMTKDMSPTWWYPNLDWSWQDRTFFALHCRTFFALHCLHHAEFSAAAFWAPTKRWCNRCGRLKLWPICWTVSGCFSMYSLYHVTKMHQGPVLNWYSIFSKSFTSFLWWDSEHGTVSEFLPWFAPRSDRHVERSASIGLGGTVRFCLWSDCIDAGCWRGIVGYVWWKHGAFGCCVVTLAEQLFTSALHPFGVNHGKPIRNHH